ncbi:ATP-binding protein [Nitrincola sp. MINF-07-Sa-05]|uniref:ATP-binding protein n=1 Tax=Nitrincola salilacus TaxID=3400273 RepID=UPI003917CC97
MKLRQVSRVFIFFTLVCLALLSIQGVLTWRQVTGGLTEIESLLEVRQQTNKVASAIDFVSLLRYDSIIIEGVKQDVLQVSQRLSSFTRLEAEVAQQHIKEIAYICDQLLAIESPGQEMDRFIASQLLLHINGLNESLELLLATPYENLMQQLLSAMASFVIGVVVFSCMALFGFVLIFRRIGLPIRTIQKSVHEFAKGNRQIRIHLDGEDELAQLAASFNHMAARLVQKEQALASSEERFRLLARATVDAIWDWDLTSDRIWWSEGLSTTFGYNLKALEQSSQTLTDPVHPEDLALMKGTLQEAISSGKEGWRMEYRYRKQNGDYAHIENNAFVIHDASGQAVRVIGGMTDLSEQVQLEEQLRQSQRLESIGQLTGGIAHDFNNLLTVILGNAELLEDELSSNDELRPLAEMIGKAAQRGAGLTQHLLAYARRQVLQPDLLDVNRMVRDMSDLLKRSLGEQVEIEIKLHPDLWPVLADRTQLESAILNLCINARDAMPTGGSLIIETDNVHLDDHYTVHYQDLNPGEYVRLAISDNGIGIEEDCLNKVFEPFFTTKEQGKGTGLGLSMVFGFIKQSNGHINIYSELGEGTVVRLYLPRAEETEEEGTLSDALQVSEARCRKVLVVEDDELVRGHAAELLESLEYQVLSAENGAVALDLIRQDDTIDILFTDIIMPGGMNGRELADQALQIRPELKILFTSGYTEHAILHQGWFEPGIQMLSKPYRRQDLVDKLTTLMDGTEKIS